MSNWDLFINLMAAIGITVCVFGLLGAIVFLCVLAKEWFLNSWLGWQYIQYRANQSEKKWKKQNGILP